MADQGARPSVFTDVFITGTKVTLASQTRSVVVKGEDLRQVTALPETSAADPAQTVYVLTLLDRENREFRVPLGQLADDLGWNRGLEGAQKAVLALRSIMGVGGGGGGGTVDTIVPGDAIAVDATDPANPIVDVLVDGVTIGFNGSNQLEVPAGGGGYVVSVGGTAPIASTGGNTPVISLNNTAVVPGSYTSADITVDAKGRITAAANGSAGTVTNVTASAPLASSGGTTPNITATTSTGGNEVADAGKLLIFGARGTITGSGDTGANGVEGFTSGAGAGVDGEASGTGPGVVGLATGGGNGGTFSAVSPGVGVQGTSDTEAGGYFLSNGPTNPAIHVNQGGAGPIAWLHNGADQGLEVGQDGGGNWTSATGAQTTATNLPAFGTATKGVVPASGGGTANFLRADGTFAVPPGTSGAAITALTGDVTATGPGSVAATLASVIVAGGPTGSATVAPIITYDAKGRLTAVSSATITPAASAITGGQALTKTDDTNVTLTLGGTPSTALLQAASITAGWTGNLAVTRGGTGVATATTAYGLQAAGTTATGAHQTLPAGATTEILVGGGASALPVWTTATGTGAPARAGSPTFTGTPAAPTAATTTNTTQLATTAFVQQELTPRDPVFLSYSGGSQATTSTSYADVHSSAAFTISSTGVYEIIVNVQHDAAATTTGAGFSWNGPTATFQNTVVDYSVLSTDKSSVAVQGYDWGVFSTSSLTTGSNWASIRTFIRFTATGTLALRFKTEVGGSAITVTSVSGFIRKISL